MLGHISRKHGYKGEVVAVFDTDQPERYEKLESVFVEVHAELVPFFIEEIAQNSRGHFILRFEDVDEKEAERFIERQLWLPLDLLPKLTGKNFYFHEVIDFKVIDKSTGPVGICLEVLDRTAQPIFRIMDDDTEVLVPAVDEFIEEIDRENKIIWLNTPEGLLDLYKGS